MYHLSLLSCHGMYHAATAIVHFTIVSELSLAAHYLIYMRKNGLIKDAGTIIVQPGAVPYLLDYDAFKGVKPGHCDMDTKVAFAHALFPKSICNTIQGELFSEDSH